MAQTYDADGFLVDAPDAKGAKPTTATPTVDADGFLIAPPASAAASTATTKKAPDWGSSVFGSIVGPPPPSSWGAQVDKDVRNLLAPKPGQQYGDIVPFKIDPKTGSFDWSAPTLPNVLRNVLTQAATPISEMATADPTTGRYGMTPEAQAAAMLFMPGNPLGFSRPIADITLADREALAARSAAARAAPGPTAEAAAATTAPPPIPSGSVPPVTPEVSAAAAARPAGQSRPIPETGMTPPAAPGQPPPAPRPPVTTPGQLQTAISETAAERAGPNLVDDNVYLPGVQRPLAAREFSPQNSLDHKIATAKDQEYRAQSEAIERNNSAVIKQTLQTDARGPDELAAARTARQSVAPEQFGAFDGERPVDATPLLTEVQKVLDGPEGKDPEIASVFNTVKKSLYDKDGNLETLPSRLYGARKVITNLLDKVQPRPTTEAASAANAAQALLSKTLPVFDDTIESGAPKFAPYRQAFSDASTPIDQMSFLQRYMPGGTKNIFDAAGNTTVTKLNSVLKDIQQGRAASGTSEAKTLTESQIQNIIAARNEMAAFDFRDRQAAVKGADTFQQIEAEAAKTSKLKALAKGALAVGAGAGAQVGAAMHGDPMLNWLALSAQTGYHGLIAPYMRANAERAAAEQVAREAGALKQELLQTRPGTRKTIRGPTQAFPFPLTVRGAAMSSVLQQGTQPSNPLTPPP